MNGNEGGMAEEEVEEEVVEVVVLAGGRGVGRGTVLDADKGEGPGESCVVEAVGWVLWWCMCGNGMCPNDMYGLRNRPSAF